MNPNQELLVGIFLILAGVVLAIFAYIVLTSKEPDEMAEELEAEKDDEMEAAPSASNDGEYDDKGSISDAGEPAGDAPRTPLEAGSGEGLRDEIIPIPAPIVTEPHQDKDRSPAMPEPVTPETPADPAPAPSTRPRIPVATILRDEVTGEIILQVGDREYTNADDLKDSPDWTRVSYAATDFNRWLDREEVKTALKYRETDTGAGSTRPQSMVEQINDILQRKIIESGSNVKAVQLIEGPGGTVRVLIGVQSYDLGDVPNDEVQMLIRESVTEWEATQ